MITIIAAIAKNNALGKNNALVWNLPSDLKRFKKITSGHPVIMGRNTFDSIAKPLPNRTNIIITRDKKYKREGCKIAHSLEEAVEIAQKKNTDIFIVGGAQIYELSMKKGLVDKLDITHIHQEFDADVFFPKIDPKVWKQVNRKDHKADQINNYDYSFVSYDKINPKTN